METTPTVSTPLALPLARALPQRESTSSLAHKVETYNTASLLLERAVLTCMTKKEVGGQTSSVLPCPKLAEGMAESSGRGMLGFYFPETLL